MESTNDFILNYEVCHPHLYSLSQLCSHTQPFVIFLVINDVREHFVMSPSFGETKLQNFREKEIKPLDSSTGTEPLPLVNNFLKKLSADRLLVNATLKQNN